MTQDGFPAVFCSCVLVVLSGSVVNNNNNNNKNNNNNNSSSSSSSSNYRINNSLPYGVFQRYNEPIIQMEHK